MAIHNPQYETALQGGIVWKVGNGEKIKFWEDTWLDGDTTLLFLSVLDPAKSESKYPIKLHAEFLGYHNPKLIVPNRYLMILITALKCDCLGLD